MLVSTVSSTINIAIVDFVCLVDWANRNVPLTGIPGIAVYPKDILRRALVKEALAPGILPF